MKLEFFDQVSSFGPFSLKLGKAFELKLRNSYCKERLAVKNFLLGSGDDTSQFSEGLAMKTRSTVVSSLSRSLSLLLIGVHISELALQQSKMHINLHKSLDSKPFTNLPCHP